MRVSTVLRESLTGHCLCSQKQQKDCVGSISRAKKELLQLDKQVKVSTIAYNKGLSLNRRLQQSMEEEESRARNMEEILKVYVSISLVPGLSLYTTII